MNKPTAEHHVIKTENAEECARWEIPNMEQNSQDLRQMAGPIAAKQLEFLKEEAYKEGFKQGESEGFATGQQAVNHHLQSIIEQAEDYFQALDESFDAHAVTLIQGIGRALFYHELQTTPDHILSIVQELKQQLPLGTFNITLTLHPRDAQEVRDHYGADCGDGWRITEDPKMAIGGAVLNSASIQVDATVDSQIKTVFQKVFGELRGGSDEE